MKLWQFGAQAQPRVLWNLSVFAVSVAVLLLPFLISLHLLSVKYKEKNMVFKKTFGQNF